jgi:site-specific DNA recombinase
MVAQTREQVRAAIYCRVSTTGQEEKGSSLDTQEASCRKYAAEHGMVVDESLVIREVYSGAELYDRPQLSALRDYIRRKRVNALIVHDIDRISRHPGHLAVLQMEAEHAGVELVFVLTPLDSTPEAQLIAYIKGWAGFVERERIRERSMRGRRAVLDRGMIYNVGSELFGYRRDRERGVRVIHEEEAVVVRRIFREIVEGKSLRTLAAELNKEGVPAPSAGKRNFSIDSGMSARWGNSGLTRILRNEAYRGETIAQKWQVDGNGGVKMRDESEWVRLGDHVTPAIVSPELWEMAQRRGSANQLQRRDQLATAATRNKERPVLLRGLVFCGVCGRPMSVDSQTVANPDNRRIYRCTSRLRDGKACGARTIRTNTLDPWVWGQIETILLQPERIAEAIAWMREQGVDETLIGERESTQRLVEKLAGSQDRLARRLTEAEDDTLFNLLAAETKRIASDLGEARARLAEIDKRLAEQEAAVVRVEDLQGYVERVRANMDEMTFERKRDAVVALVERVIVNADEPDSWRIEASIPTLTEASGIPSTRRWSWACRMSPASSARSASQRRASWPGSSP